MKAVVCVALLLVCFTGCAYSWGVDGHQIVAQIGASFLTSTTQTAVNKMLNGQSLADIATWPDNYDHTTAGSWSERLHFVNLDISAQNFTYSACFPTNGAPGCVITAITNSTAILESDLKANYWEVCNDEDESDAPCQLSFLVHFLGDSHQPLHVAYDVDEGGNSYKATFNATCTNLHSVWDKYLITSYETIYKLNWLGIANELIAYLQQNPNMVKQFLTHTRPDQWGDETFTAARLVPYNTSPGSVAPTAIWLSKYANLTDTSAGHFVSSTSTSCGPQLGSSYYTRTIPVVMTQLAKAGVRLGHHLNSIYDPTFTGFF